jgi:hopanoid-associated phosphorylase
MKLVAVASDPMEFPGILKRSREVRPCNAPIDWARLVSLGGHDLLLAANGVGNARAAAAVEAALEHFAADGVVSTGFCGALQPELAIGDVVVATCVSTSRRRYAALPAYSNSPHRRGVVCSSDRVARTAEEKRLLGEGGALAVEMEAAGVAECAAARGLPFYCIRAVTDLAAETMANDFNRALRRDGHFDTIVILRGTLRRPWVCLPELIRLRKRCVQAAVSLGDFFADCRF